MILRASERFFVAQPGIETRQCFSAGGFYDASRLSAGALIGVDEHVIAAGAGFAEHAHRGVDIVSWVVAGALRHDSDLVVSPGKLLVQSTGSGIRHAESNASDEPLRLIQMTLVSSADAPSTRLTLAPLAVDGGTFHVHRFGSLRVAAPAHLYVVRGDFDVGDDALAVGDSSILDTDATAAGEGELLIWELRD